MPKPGLPFTKEDFFFNDHEKRIFFIALRVAGAAVALGLITILTVAGVSSVVRSAQAAERKTVRATPTPDANASPAVTAGRSVPGVSTTPAATLSDKGELEKPMSLNDFILRDDFRTPKDFDYSLFLPRTGTWDRAAIERFWVDPRRIGLENLKKLNDKNIENLFEGVQ